MFFCLFFVINIFHRGRYRLPQEAIGPLASNFISRGSVPESLRQPIALYDFPGGDPDPLSASLDLRMVFIHT